LSVVAAAVLRFLVAAVEPVAFSLELPLYRCRRMR
jgi:hypothetical protein